MGRCEGRLYTKRGFEVPSHSHPILVTATGKRNGRGEVSHASDGDRKKQTRKGRGGIDGWTATAIKTRREGNGGRQGRIRKA